MLYICLVCNNKFRKNTDTAWQQCPRCQGDAWWENSGYIVGTISTPVVPSWRRYEEQMRQGTPDQQLKAADNFNKERERATKADPKMAKWEKSRKDWFQKQKKGWRNKEIAKLKEKGL